MKAQKLLNWYKENHRKFPWRETADPYKIWISEVMLQQTTSTAVIPYFERFLSSFPNLKTLAKAPLSEVLKNWSGLGYYSRARNLHKSAIQLSKDGFPTSYKELLNYPGFGPYTSRAVSSFAFNEQVGVLDGNVIRFLSRFEGKPVEWWTPKGRAHLQAVADQWANHPEASEINQALIEIGATICTSTSPKCILCPVMKTCQSRGTEKIETLPLKKPRKKMEIWLWEPAVPIKRNQLGLVKNEMLPFLKGQWIWPGSAKKLSSVPLSFDFKHCITHHQIYVKVQAASLKKKDALKWISADKLTEFNPTSLVQKVWEHSQKS